MRHLLAFTLALTFLAACDKKREAAAPPSPEPGPEAAVTKEPAAPVPAPAPSIDAAPAAAPPAAPIEPTLSGQYGFDWLNPTKTSCTAYDGLAAKLADATCELRESGGFGGTYEGPSTACRLGKAEWLFYPTEKDCKTAFEDMQANAP